MKSSTQFAVEPVAYGLVRAYRSIGTREGLVMSDLHGSAWLGAFDAEDGELAGFVCVAPVNRAMRIRSLYVLSQFRRRGLGLLLVKAAVEQCGQRAATAFCNKVSKKIFESCGFVVHSEGANGTWFLRREELQAMDGPGPT